MWIENIIPWKSLNQSSHMHPSSPSLRLKYYAVSGNGIGRGTEKGRQRGRGRKESRKRKGREGKEEEKRNASSSLPLLKGFL